MKLMMLTGLSGPAFSLSPRDTHDFNLPEAIRLVDAGFAEPTDREAYDAAVAELAPPDPDAEAQAQADADAAAVQAKAEADAAAAAEAQAKADADAKAKADADATAAASTAAAASKPETAAQNKKGLAAEAKAKS
ncbi:hypothetical protein [Blastomonas sp.]|uniref:hypothetical protein n=1 Tax=Blastomonas sp. TaxID=1909299 RepID=UPI003918A3E6